MGTLEGKVAGLTEQVFICDHLSVIADRKVHFPDVLGVSWKQLAGHPLVTVQPGYDVRRSIDQAAAAAAALWTRSYAVCPLMHVAPSNVGRCALARSHLGAATEPV